MEQMKIVDIGTKFRWRVIKNPEGTYTGICDRLKLTIEAETLEGLADYAASESSMLLLDLWGKKEFNQYTFDHSIAYTITDITNIIEVAPTPFIIEAV